MIEMVSHLKSDGTFISFLEWIESERDARDVENRKKGYENTTSEAAALTTILEVAVHKSRKYKQIIANVGNDANEERAVW